MHNIFNQSIANVREIMSINYNKHFFYISKRICMHIGDIFSLLFLVI